MTATLLLCASLAASPPVEQAPPPRPVADDAVTRYIKRLRAEGSVVNPFLSEFDQVRLRHLRMIAMTRRTYLEHIELFEKVQNWSISPEMKLKCQQAVEKMRKELLELDERERRCQEDGPPLPPVTLPPRP